MIHSVKPSFKPWVTFVDSRRDDLSLSSDFYAATNEALASRTLEGRPHRYQRIFSERRWHQLGSPYFKVWPGIAGELLKTSFDFTDEAFHPCYDVFAIYLPTSLRGYAGSRHRALISIVAKEGFEFGETFPGGIRDLTGGKATVAQWEKKAGVELSFAINVFMPMVAVSHDLRPTIAFSQCMVGRGQRLSECLNLDCTEIESLHGEAEPPSNGGAMLSNFVRVSIGVNMFAIGRHALVAPDVKQPIINAKPRGKKKAKAVAQLERPPTKCKGWLVGSEIDLPRPLVVGDSTHKEDTGAELEYGHIRSGHMRMQACGPKLSERRLVYIAPMIIRPDLPVRQSHGYRVKG